MVQVEARERKTLANTVSVTVDTLDSNTPSSTPSSPSKYKKTKIMTTTVTPTTTTTATAAAPASPTCSSSSTQGGRELISYTMKPTPPPEPLPFPFGFILAICCGGNMKYIVFPTLMAVSLGLFLAFSKAVSTTTISRGYSHYQNSRQLSEDDPNFPRGNLLFANLLKDHAAFFSPQLAQQQQQREEQQEHHLHGRQDALRCDCSRCDTDSEATRTNPSQYKRLVKHSFQHFYGRRELAVQVEAFVPSKRKQWDFNPAFYNSASHVCSDDTSPLAIVLVNTYHRHLTERNAIRDTWGSVTRGNAWPHRQLTGEVRLIFILELSEDPIDNNLATTEANKYGDIVLVDIQENKHPDSRKVLSGFKWVQDFCSGAQYVVKVEEDTFLDLPLLLHILAYQEMTNMILGPIAFAEPVTRETSGHKLLVSRHAYFPDWYPPHALGNVYAMPTTLSKRILAMAEYLPYVGVEDAFITGILAKVFDARHINIPERLFNRTANSKPELCDFVYRKKMAAHVKPALAHSLWRRIDKAEMCGLFPGPE